MDKKQEFLKKEIEQMDWNINYHNEHINDAKMKKELYEKTLADLIKQ